MVFYSKSKVGELPTNPFEYGVHKAIISDINDKKSARGYDQFVINLDGNEHQKGNVTITFGTKFTEEALMRLIASVEGAGTVIPEIDFDYNPETVSFLLGKPVFIWARVNTYTDNDGNERKNKKLEFITFEEFEALGGQINNEISVNTELPINNIVPLPEEPPLFM
ncbi:type III secretion system protein PrgE [Lactococcus petauri]|uniref:Type III secretion system protein PrgE n=1 Tax=Lactococcus petauri TaxID=1940789 RepID=A0AAJ2IYJ5_9LACT|nr:type III secretion system protein PrgE [Lactococcus petauri]MDT2527158.1 type III secretion system protein PrgE [Lactococcus petauri]MDT2541727.1 type III secretion system protein PrgE [Lactococcus petauri]MDT2560435.1 type III secretion system protein PrgE [Lactococcus petauri]MDT2568983.1 type III secretion system protein PrgE [Lactococcus petauri]MDT2587945.1 type III secretion system protein PrgE [Lactococcus petauri]